MTFFESIKVCFKKYAKSGGRASGSDFWWWQLFTLILGIISYIPDAIFFPPMPNEVMHGELGNQMTIVHNQEPAPVFGTICTVITFLPSIAVSMRRLHDVNKSGWWQFIAITIIGIIPLLIWFTKKSDEGSNRFGDSPL